MNMKQVIPVGLLALLLLSLGAAPDAFDYESDASQKESVINDVIRVKAISKIRVERAASEWDAPESLRGLGGASVKLTLVDGNGDRHNLYPTFDDREGAIRKVAKECKQVVSLLQETYGLEGLSESNWRSYQEAMYSMYARDDRPQWYTEGYGELWELRSFFDIYENDETNAEIIEVAKKSGIEAVVNMLPSE